MLHVLLLAGCLAGQADGPLDFPPIQPYRHSCPIATTYDRFTDISVCSVKLGRLVPKDAFGWSLVALNEFRGRDRKAADRSTEITLMFWTLPTPATSSSLLVDNDVFLVYQKGRIQGPDHRSKFLAYNGDGPLPGSYWSVSVSVKMSEFLDLANSDWSECRVGKREYRLTDQQCAGLRDFAARMAFDEATVNAKLGISPTRSAKDRPSDAKVKALAAPPSPNDAGPGQAATKLRMAQEMERRENTAAAIERYKEVAAKYPGTPQAKAAERRLKILQADQTAKKRSELGQ